jgi:hypothetical protein
VCILLFTGEHPASSRRKCDAHYRRSVHNVIHGINGVLDSDFVYPAWFESYRSAGSTQFDQQLRITELLPGGYISIYDMTSGTGWQQVSRPMPLPAAFGPQRVPIGSWRERRRTPHNQWVRSAAMPAGVEQQFHVARFRPASAITSLS